MATGIPIPAGFRGTRGELLVALKMAQPLTAKELADQFGVTTNGLRRYLKALEREGLVQYLRQIRGVGGPVFAYSLTAGGEALFPRTYDTALEHALEHVRASEGTDGIVRLFRRRWEQMAESAKAEISQLPVAERAHRLAALLTSLGYMAEAVETAGTSSAGSAQTLHEHNCAIRSIAERYPEVCDAEERFIEEVLGTEITRQAHIAKGANCCTYCIQTSPAPDTAIVTVARGESWREA